MYLKMEFDSGVSCCIILSTNKIILAFQPFPKLLNSHGLIKVELCCYHSYLGIIILYRKIVISTEPNIRLTWDQSVNLSLSVVVQQKRTRVLYLSHFNRDGQTKFESTFFQIAKLRFLIIFNDFRQNSRIFKYSQGTSIKARDLIFWILVLHIRM